MIEILWRLLPEGGVRRNERGRFVFFVSLSGLLSLGQTLGITGAESLFLAEFGADYLPEMFIAASGATVVASLLYATWVGRVRNDVYFIRMLLLCAGLLAVGAWAAYAALVWIYPVLFCFQILTAVVLLSHYWTFTTDYFDTLASKRLVPLFIIGSSLGGFAGGGVAVGISMLAGPAALIASWSAALAGTAALLWAMRRPLRRWGPLELEEADETSFTGMAGALRYMPQSPLSRWLVLSTVGMVLALFVSQYLYSDILVRSFPTAESLAIFVGVFLAVTNLIEIVIETAVTPWLIRVYGVPTANLVHPVLTVAAFAALAFDFNLPAAVAARANRELVENSLSQPVRTLVYNALPLRFRGRIRAFLEGIVLNAGIVLAGLVLLGLSGRLDPLWLCLAGGATAALYLGANLAVRREYVRTIVRRLGEGRLDLASIEGELGGFEATRLAQLWESLLADERKQLSTGELKLAGVLADRGLADPLILGCGHGNARVRLASVEALARLDDPRAEQTLHASIDDTDPAVRTAAIAGAASKLRGRGEDPDRATAGRFRAHLDDPDPGVRAEAALAVARELGFPVLTELANAGGKLALAALPRLPHELASIALRRTEDPDPEVRAAALDCVARLERANLVDVGRLAADIEAGETPVRQAVVRLAARRLDPAALELLGTALHDTDREVRRLASEALASLGDRGVAIAAAGLDSRSPVGIEAVLATLSLAGTHAARETLRRELRRRVVAAWVALLSLAVLERDRGPRFRYLRAALEDASTTSRRLAFRTLEYLEDASVIRTVEKVLRVPSARTRADALEVLANLGDRESSQLLVLMLEQRATEDKIPEVARYVPPPREPRDIIARAAESEDRWLRLAAEKTHMDDDHPEEGDPEMDRLLVLRTVSLFEHLTLDQLEAVNRLVDDVQYVRGEILMKEGDVGDQLYILIDGEVDVWREYGTPRAILLNKLQPIELLGEMSILDNQPRSATLVTTEDSRMLYLDGERFKELILQQPEIAFEIFRVLSERLREVEDRLVSLSGGGA